MNRRIHSQSRTPQKYGYPLGAVIALLLTLTANPSSAQEAKLASEKRAQLEDTISKFMAANGVPGLSAAVVFAGE